MLQQVLSAIICRAVRMADIFVSYTSGDREWAFWIGPGCVKTKSDLVVTPSGG
jgi:hypothetical protein